MNETTLKQDVEWFVKTSTFLAPYGGKRGETLLKKFLTIYDKKEILPILCDLLPTAKPKFKLVIVNILGFIGDETIVPILEEFLDSNIPKKYSSYTYFRTEMNTKYLFKGFALESLGRLENESANKVLFNYLQKTNDKDNIQTIIHCFSEYKIQSQEVLNSIVDMAVKGKTTQLIFLYIELARRYKLKDAEQILLKKLEKERDESVIMRMLGLLATYRTWESMNAIIYCFKNVKGYYNQIRTLELLGRIDISLSFHILKEEIKPTKEERTRLYALEGFRILRSKKILGTLFQLIDEDQNCNIRTKALRVIYSIAGRKYTQKYLQYLQDKGCPKLRITAIWIIKKYKEDIAKPILLKMLREDEDQLVRRAALFALEKFTSEEIIKEIKSKTIAEEGIEIRRAAFVAIERIQESNTDKFIIEAMKFEKNNLVKRLQIRILARLNTDSAIAALLEELQSSKVKMIRNSILTALGRTKRKDVVKNLMEIYLKDEDMFIRYLTACMILKLDDQKAIETIREGYSGILNEKLAKKFKDNLKEYELFYNRGHSLGIL